MIEQGFIQVWCDIGGTFTDCIVAFPDGSQRACKVLSHGVMQGKIDEQSEGNFRICAREKDPAGFWEGATIHTLNEAGQRTASLVCTRFDAGRFWYQPNSEALSTDSIANDTACIELDLGIEAPVLATRLLLGCPLSNPLPELRIRLGTTRGTNALLTRNGAKTLFLTTGGFRDLLVIGYQERPDLFSLHVRKRPPLYEKVIEVSERLDANGEVLREIDVDGLHDQLADAFQTGFRSLAVCLVHSYCNPVHELRIREIASRIGFDCVCLSHEVAPRIKAVARGETTVVDAYLTPIVHAYLERVRKQFGQPHSDSLLIMTSAGGLVPTREYRGKDSVLSGPAGGAVALHAISESTGIRPLIGLDMGGTSTDVCRVDGELELDYETVKAGVRMMSPTLRIHTVAAGGGSICWFDGVQWRVGPQSAGSNPGPACYGRGGPLTVTDLNLLANRIDPDSFPFPLDREAAERALDSVWNPWKKSKAGFDSPMTKAEFIEGFRAIANEHMASAVRSISIAQGADPRQHSLVAFGGAAGQHICQIAEILGMSQIIDPPAAGLLSALGMGMASRQFSVSAGVYQEIDALSPDWLIHAKERLMKNLGTRREEIETSSNGWEESIRLDARYRGTEGTLPIPYHDPGWNSVDFQDRFHRQHKIRFGYDRPQCPIEIAAVHGLYRSKATNRLPSVTIPSPDAVVDLHVSPQGSAAGTSNCPHLDRTDLQTGTRYHGPLLIRSAGSTTFLDRGWTAVILADQTLLLEPLQKVASGTRHRTHEGRSHLSRENDPVLREILAKRISAIADQMGTVLEQTAISVNVKDRRDFSCAVFNATGDLIANAPHVPVHLGAMSATVKQMIDLFQDMRPDDCFITNDPYRGGSHLPDVTVVTPVFANVTEPDHSQSPSIPDFFVACRAHHAEIGGIAPGSMAPTSTSLAEEGVLIPPMRLSFAGVDRSEEVEQLLRTSPWPSRSVPENMADIAAQQAANQYGVRALVELASQFGPTELQGIMEQIQAASQAKTERWIQSLARDEYSFADAMDDGTPIQVRISKRLCSNEQTNAPKLRIDFTGTGPESPGNLNANPAIVSAAVMYVIRCAIADDLPLNSGVMRCVELVIPPGILNPQKRNASHTEPPLVEASQWPAVAGGNVETSQRVVDCLLGALGLAAASQGTMNNFLFGNKTFGYYETIGGGAGATSLGPGEDAVHTHMTNTRLTDVEILERRYPVRLVEFGIRHHSGGAGKHPGGNGMVRQIQALVPLSVSLVTSRRQTYLPQGIQGGEPGSQGENWRVLESGERQRLPSNAQIEIQAGDSIRILTPGGGGFGTTNSDRQK